MLDRRRIYGCAYWRTATQLDDAQEAKLDLVCRKLALEPGGDAIFRVARLKKAPSDSTIASSWPSARASGLIALMLRLPKEEDFVDH